MFFKPSRTTSAFSSSGPVGQAGHLNRMGSVQRSGGLTEARTIQRKIRNALLSYVWVLMFLVWAEHCQSLRAEDSNDAAEDVSLFVVDLDQFGATLLDVINGFPDVDKFQALRQRGVAAMGHASRMRHS